MVAFETEKKKTSVRIFHWRPDIHGYYHSAGAQDVLLMTLSGMVVLVYSVHHRRGQDRKKGGRS